MNHTLGAGWDEHRRLYPDQYNHPLVGKRVSFLLAGKPATGVVLRVLPSRFGPLASIDTLPSNEAVALSALTEVS